MSVCVHYWAIPPASRLYARLQTDRAVYALMASLFPYGGGVFHFCTIDPDEADEILDDVTGRDRAALGSEAEARRHVADFLAELDRTRAAFPGIEQRAYMIEKCSADIERCLTQALRKDRADAADFVRQIMFGDISLAEHLRRPGETILGLVTPPVVADGAAALERLQPADLFPGPDGWDDWCRDNYQAWREMYGEAARYGEVVLIGVT